MTTFHNHSKLTDAKQLNSADMVIIDQLAMNNLIDAGYTRVSSKKCRAIFITKKKSSVVLCKANSDLTYSAMVINSRNLIDSLALNHTVKV